VAVPEFASGPPLALRHGRGNVLRQVAAVLPLRSLGQVFVEPVSWVEIGMLRQRQILNGSKPLDTELINRIGIPGVVFYMVARDAFPRIMAKWKRGDSSKVQGMDKNLAVLEQRTKEIEEKIDEHHQAIERSLTDHTQDDVKRFDQIQTLLSRESEDRREENKDLRDIQVRQLERLGKIEVHLEHLLVSRPRRQATE